MVNMNFGDVTNLNTTQTSSLKMAWPFGNSFGLDRDIALAYGVRLIFP